MKITEELLNEMKIKDENFSDGLIKPDGDYVRIPRGDEGSQPSSGGNIPTKPATTTSTTTDDTTDRNGQLTSGKGALPKTGETTERPAFGFLGVIVVSLMGVLGLKRKQREE